MSNLIGQSLGRYHILEQIGEGGMAVVYKAYDTRLEIDVAVKIIRMENITLGALDRTLKRFEREAKALARLTHPNIVKVTDYGEYEGKPYLVMPLLSGGTLKSKLSGKPMPWQEAVQILIPIADALGYAHKHDIIHRDVKPANILITENGQPMLADFGVAKMLDVEETMELTGTGVGLGTPEYMAPEQVTNRLVDARVDIYALGVVLFEMVTGRKPFIADTPMAVLFKHASDPLPRPKSFVPDLPQAVENVIIKSLAKKPENRFQNMADFAKAMEEVSSGKKFGVPKANKDEKRAEFKLPAIPRRVMVTIGLIVLGFGLFAVFFKPLSALLAQLFATPTPTFTSTPMLTFMPAVSPTPTLSIGSTMISEKDGMTLDYVPEGKFTMGSYNGNTDEQPIHIVYLYAFWIDQNEVTNKQYAACVTAGKCDAPSRTSSYTRDSYYGNSEFDEFPVTYVNWDNAKKYCEWAGRRLPTEAEWEKAARGTDQRTYPWGNDLPNNGLLNFNNSSIGDTTEVGKYPNGASPYGAYDMAGNVGEWVNDWYSITYYQNSPSSNPFGPNSSVSRVSRGGSWLDGNLNVRSASRSGNYPSGTYYFIGFRCARGASP